MYPLKKLLQAFILVMKITSAWKLYYTPTPW
jgi:hypothetical protein